MSYPLVLLSDNSEGSHPPFDRVLPRTRERFDMIVFDVSMRAGPGRLGDERAGPPRTDPKWRQRPPSDTPHTDDCGAAPFENGKRRRSTMSSVNHRRGTYAGATSRLIATVTSGCSRTLTECLPVFLM
ncbi:hypothetical protein TL08_26860 [Actinoalloteichus hymeniacidonis]|uniref:Uncharacterized protein n=1 Tax=Actinoalloteichus hymeniacidonis TaxID=340345 RepID=A0AAC9HX75_9PSEU|nr:hypothetical protein TL08_26860 [Actinoalloteichus hymeniacidonis]